jgi:hypothetical protein
LLLLLLFLAVSISADELFVTMTSSNSGKALLLFGYLFSAVVSEAVFWGARIRLGWRFVIPYHMFLALFYFAPWWCAPGLNPDRSRATLDWTLFLFPVVAALLILTLLPAVRRGASYVAENGTPWKWPMFPWIAFGIIGCFLGFRSFALCMSFGPTGNIWQKQSSGLTIVFDTIWGTYFLVPLVLAVLLLLLEMGLVAKNKRFVQRVMTAAPILLAVSFPLGGALEFRRFLDCVVEELGSPLWLTVWLLFGFYFWSWLRHVPRAGVGVLSTLTLVSVVGPETIGLTTLTEPQAWPLLAVSTILLIRGLWTKNSKTCAASTVVGMIGLWIMIGPSHALGQGQTQIAEFRFSTCYHFLWLTTLIWGLAFRDRFALILRAVAAVQVPLISFVVLVSHGAADIPVFLRLLYVILLAAGCLAIAVLWRNRWYLFSSAATGAILGYTGVVVVFRQAVSALGRPAMTAFAWSVGMLLLAFLITAHKARWLPKWVFPQGRDGNQLKPSVSGGDRNPERG